MGYMRHHAIIVTSEIDERIAQAHSTALDIFGAQVSEIVRGTSNNCQSFLIGPDGSKEGWTESREGDEQRERFMKWLDAERHEDGYYTVDWVEVQYGDDNNETKATRDSDAWLRERTNRA